LFRKGQAVTNIKKHEKYQHINNLNTETKRWANEMTKQYQTRSNCYHTLDTIITCVEKHVNSKWGITFRLSQQIRTLHYSTIIFDTAHF